MVVHVLGGLHDESEAEGQGLVLGCKATSQCSPVMKLDQLVVDASTMRGLPERIT